MVEINNIRHPSEVPDNSFVFLVGSQRSGTTILGEILDKHPDISQWYEPLFVWDRFFRNHPHDERTADDATPEIIEQISRDFLNYKRKKGSKIIFDKSPQNSLKIPFIKKIFPNSRFIHIIRDGRDATLSINKEWKRRQSIINPLSDKKKYDYIKAFKVIRNWLRRQPFLKDKIRALWFETHGNIINMNAHFNRLRWNGMVGWGLRFKGWQDIISHTTMLQFNAYQWVKCVEAVKKGLETIPEKDKLDFRYEDLLGNEREVLSRIMHFLDLEENEDFYYSIPALNKVNYNKWRKEFTPQQIEEILDILAPGLLLYNYEI